MSYKHLYINNANLLWTIANKGRCAPIKSTYMGALWTQETLLAFNAYFPLVNLWDSVAVSGTRIKAQAICENEQNHVK